MILSMLEIAGGHLKKIASYGSIAFSHIGKAHALCQTHRGVDDRLRGEPMGVGVFQAKNVACQVECANLSPSVGEKLVAANGAIDHLVDVFRRLGLTEDFGSPAVLEFA